MKSSGELRQGRLFDPDRYAPTSIAAMLRLPNAAAARHFMVASALGRFVYSDGSRGPIQHVRDAAGIVITPTRLPTVLEVLGVGPRHWRRLVKDWESRYIAHRCGPRTSCLFARPMLSPCPGCGAELYASELPPPAKTARGEHL